MGIENKKGIYLKGELINIYNECMSGKRDRTFSGRMVDIAERYKALISLADVPTLTDDEQMILGDVVIGYVDKIKIKNLPEYILDTEVYGCKKLAEKVSKLDYLQRVSLIESLNI